MKLTSSSNYARRSLQRIAREAPTSTRIDKSERMTPRGKPIKMEMLR